MLRKQDRQRKFTLDLFRIRSAAKRAPSKSIGIDPVACGPPSLPLGIQRKRENVGNRQLPLREAVCWLPGAAVTCCQSPAFENVIFAKLLCVALRHCIPIYTQQLVAADLSGLRMILGGKRKSMDAKVELQIGRS